MMIRRIIKSGHHNLVFKSCKKQTMSCLNAASAPTAGIIVIGDEILKGQVRDSNSHFITSRLYNIGVRVMRVSVVGDDIDEISNEVRKFSRLYTYVITSGGIGPTHDDVTFEGVAKAFDESVAPHPELVKICSEFYNTNDLSSPAMKLASVPISSKLKYGFDTVQNRRAKYPNISVQNVYIFPGVPPLLEKSFTILCEDLFGGSGVKFYQSELFINTGEVSIAEQLSKAVEEFPSVAFGSYPQHDNSYFQVKLTVEANHPELLSKAVKRLKELLPHDCIVVYDPQPLVSSYEKIKAISVHPGMSHVSKALDEVMQTLTGARTQEIVLCIDASITSVVTLHLLHAVQQKLKKEETVVTVLIRNQESIMCDKFLEECVKRYSLCPEFGPNDINSALSAVFSSHVNTKHLIIGFQFSNDILQGILESLSMNKTVSLLTPVFSWSEDQVLHFIRQLNLPYLE